MIATMTGCTTAKSFVDQTYPKIAYSDVKKTPTPLHLQLSAQFQRNGELAPNLDKLLRDSSGRILRETGVIEPVLEGGDGTINIVINNIADIGNAVLKGFGTGLTLGLIGNTVTDAYEMAIIITVNNKKIERIAIKHALHSAIGNTSTPEGVETMPTNVAFERVLEQMILRALKDMQATGELSRHNLKLDTITFTNES
jgi:hypothetical protein